jgi:hypothetical protein
MILNKNQKIYFYLIGIFSLLISSIMGENSSGGSKLDNEITRQFIDNFLISFDNGIKYFINSGQVQSPIFYVLASFIEKSLGFNFLKFLYLFISSLIPAIFYISLKKKFIKINENILYLLSLIIFLSPYFRSSAVWVTTDNFAIIFFILSVSKYLDFEKKNTNKNILLCIFYISIAVYIRQYFIIFFLFYFLKFFEILSLKKIFNLIFIITIIFIPFFVYYYYFFKVNIIDQSFGQNTFGINILNNILIFSSLYLFYTIPFYINNLTDIKKNIFKNLNRFLIFFFVFGAIYFYYPLSLDILGGGVFIKISNILNSKIIFLASSFLGTLLILMNLNKNNFIVYLCLIFAFPKIIIYQKYYDPLLIITILTFTKGGILNQILNLNKINLIYIYSYFIFFFIISNFYYSLSLWI